MKYVLRDYQEKAVDNTVNYIESDNNKGVVILPSGAGKSIIIAEIIRALNNPCTIVLQPSRELLLQNYEKYTSQGEEASLYSASVGTKEVGHVTYATPGSVKNSSEEFKNLELVLIDECHLGCKVGSMVDKFIKNLESDVKVVGLTATPIELIQMGSMNNNWSQLNFLTRTHPQFWNDVVHVTQISNLYENNYLTPIRYTRFDYDLRSAKFRGSDYDMGEVSKLIEEKGLIPFTVDLLQKCIKKGKKKILVFTPTVGDAYKITDQIDNSCVISSKTKKKKRKRWIDNFVNGDLKVLLNYNTLTVGFDAPKIDLIVCLRPTNSYAIYYQLLCRGNRLAEGKRVCDFIDLSGNYKTFGKVENMHIENVTDFGWAITVRDHVLTNIPIGQKIHKDNFDVLEKKITFGKYKGTPYKEVPSFYLEWVRDNFNRNSFFEREVKPSLKALNII